MSDRCHWCGQPYQPSRRGSPQRFCSPAHRRAYDQAARDWVRQAIATGLLSVADLQNAHGKARALGTVPLSASPVPETPKHASHPAPTPSDAGVPTLHRL